MPVAPTSNIGATGAGKPCEYRDGANCHGLRGFRDFSQLARGRLLATPQEETPTKTLRFYGIKDDTFVCDGDVHESADCWNREGVFLLQSKKPAKGKAGRLMVCGKYAPQATGTRCWMVGISMGGEGIPLPNWPIRFEVGHDYSPVLVIAVPDDVTVTVFDSR